MSDIAQEIKTNIVFNAQQAIRNATELHNALQKISNLDFNNLANAFAQVGNALKLAEKNSVKLGKAISQSQNAIATAEVKTDQANQKHIDKLKNLAILGNNIIGEIEGKKSKGKVFDETDFNAYRQRFEQLADKFRDIAPIDMIYHFRQSLVETFSGAKFASGFNPVDLLRNEELQNLVSQRNRLIQQMNDVYSHGSSGSQITPEAKADLRVKGNELQKINRDVFELCLKLGDAERGVRLLTDAMHAMNNAEQFPKMIAQLKKLSRETSMFEEDRLAHQNRILAVSNKMAKDMDDFFAKKDAGKAFTEKQLTDFRDKFYSYGKQIGILTESNQMPRMREMFAQMVTGVKTRGDFDVSKLLDVGKPDLGTNNLLQQRLQLIKQMQDAYSRDRNVDLSMDLAKLREINAELSRMYLNFRQLQQAKKIMEDAIAIAGNQSATFGLDKHYKDILRQLEDANSRIKQYQYDTDFNGSRSRVDKYYDRVQALVASQNDRDQKLVGVEINQKAKQESKFEQLERKLANDVAKIQFEKDSGKTFASYDIDQRIQRLYGYATGMNNIVQGGKAFDGAQLQIFPVVDRIVAELKNGMKIVTGEQIRQQKEQIAKDREESARKKSEIKAESDREKNLLTEHNMRFNMEKKSEKELFDHFSKISSIVDKVYKLQDQMSLKTMRGEKPSQSFIDKFEYMKGTYAKQLFDLTNGVDYRPIIEQIAPKYTGQSKQDAKKEADALKAQKKELDENAKAAERLERSLNNIRNIVNNSNMTGELLSRKKINEMRKELEDIQAGLLSIGGTKLKPVLDSLIPKLPTFSREDAKAQEQTYLLRSKLEQMEEKALQRQVQKISKEMDKVYRLRDEMNAFTDLGENPSQKTLNRFNRQRNEYIRNLSDMTGVDYSRYVDAILPKSPTRTKEMDRKERDENKAIERDLQRINDAWKTVFDIQKKIDTADITGKLFSTEKIENFKQKLAEARQMLISIGGEHYAPMFDKIAPKLPTWSSENEAVINQTLKTQSAIDKSIERQNEKKRKEEERQQKQEEKERQRAQEQEFKEFNEHWKKYSTVKDRVDRLKNVIDSKNSRGEYFSEKELASIESQKAKYARQLTEITGVDWKPILERTIPKAMTGTIERERNLQEEQKIRNALAKDAAKRTAEEQKSVAKYYQDLNKLEQKILDIRAEINRKNSRGELFSQKELDRNSATIEKITDQLRILTGTNYKPIIDSIMPKPLTGTIEAKRAQDAQIKADQKAAKDEEKQIQNRIKHLEQLEKLAKQVAEVMARINDKKISGGFFSAPEINRARRQIERLIDDMNRISSVDLRPIVTSEFDKSLVGIQYRNQNDRNQSGKIESPTMSGNLQAQLEAARQKAHECAVQLQFNNTIAGQLNFMRALKELRDLEKQVEGVNHRLNQTFTLFNNIGELVGKRMTWYLGDYLAGIVYNLPIDAIDKFRELDQAMAGVQQVMPLIENNQAEINNEMSRFLEISNEYAQEIAGVVEAGQLWGRGYGKPVIDVDLKNMIGNNPDLSNVTNEIVDYVAKAEAMRTTNELVAQSAMLATVDNFSMMESVKGLEAILAAYGLRAESAAEATLFAGRAVDIVTKVAHYGQISAQDLVRGIEATGAAAADAGISLEFLSAMIETGTRNTGLSGSNIGNAIKALTAAFDTPKAEKALKEFGVDINQIGEDGKTRLRPLQDVVLEISQAIANGDQNARALIKTLAGGRMQFSKIMSILKDPAEIMRMWGEALDSAGFAEEQLKVQMGTINAHVKQLKTEFASFFQTVMRGGGKSGIISVVDGITNALKFLEEHMTGIKAVMGAFLAMKFASWAFGFIGAIRNMITSVHTFSLELQRAGVANASLGAILSSGFKESVRRAVTFQSNTDLTSTQQIKNLTEQLKNVDNQNTAAKSANTAANVANTQAKTANSTATIANSTATVANSTADTANSAAKTVNTTATLANRNAQAAKAAMTQMATVATTALTAAELRQAAVTTVATAGLNLLVLAFAGVLAAAAEYAFSQETVEDKLDRTTNTTRKEINALEDEIDKLKQEVIARKNCIDYTEKAIDMYINASEAIKKYEKNSEQWVKYTDQMRAAEQGLAEIFGKDAVQRIKDSDNMREAYKLEKATYDKVTEEKVKRLRELNKRLADFYKNRGLEVKKEAEFYQTQIDNFGKWTEAQLKGLSFLRKAWMLYHQAMFNFDKEGLQAVDKAIEEQAQKIKKLDPKGEYFNPYDRRANTKENREKALPKIPFSKPELLNAMNSYIVLKERQEALTSDMQDRRDTVMNGSTWLPFDGIKEQLHEATILESEFRYKAIDSLMASNDPNYIDKLLGVYQGEEDGGVVDKDDDSGKPSKDKEPVNYKDEILMSLGGIANQSGIKLPVSVLWSLGANINSEGDPWKLLTENRTNNPLGVTSALMQEYYPNGQLGNVFDNARVFAEFVKERSGKMSNEDIIKAWLEAVFPNISDEDIQAKIKDIFGEADFLDTKFDFKKNIDQIHPPEKVIYDPFSQIGAQNQSNIMQPVYRSSNDFSDLLTRTPDPARIWDYLRANGANENTAAGIMGSMKYESDNFKAAVENYEGSGARGLFQLMNERYWDFLDWTEQKGYSDPWQALPQLEYILQVDNHNQKWSAPRAGLSDWSLDTLNRSSYSASDIAYYFEHDWERPGDSANYAQVMQNATEILAMYRNRPIPSDNLQTPPIVQQISTVPTDRLESQYYQKWTSAQGIVPFSDNGLTNTVDFKPAMFEFLNMLDKEMNQIGVVPIITGGADQFGHAQGTYSHANGYKVDLNDSEIPEGSKAYDVLMTIANQFGAEVVHEVENGHYDIVIRRDNPIGAVNQQTTAPTALDVSNGYVPKVGDNIFIDQSYQTEEGVVEEGIKGIITAIEESGDAIVALNSEEFQGEYRLNDVLPLGELKVFRGGTLQPINIQSPPMNQGTIYENYWDVNKSNFQTLRNLKLDSFGAYEIYRKRQTDEYQRVREQIASDRKIHGDSAELDQQEIVNERKALTTIENDKKILEEMNSKANEIISSFYDKYSTQIESLLERNNTSWDRITTEDKTKIAEELGAKDVVNFIKIQDRVQKELDETNKRYDQQRRIVEELRGILTPEKADEWRLNKLQQDYQIRKSADEYQDPFIDRQFQREQIEIYQRQLERQQNELDIANMLADVRKQNISSQIEQTKATITNLEAQKNAGANVTLQINEQISKLQELEAEFDALSEYGTAAQIRTAEAVRKTTIEINNLNQALNLAKRRETIETTRLNKLKLDFDVEKSASPFSDQESTIEYTHQRLNLLTQLREDYQSRLLAAQEEREVRKTSIDSQINSTNKNIENLRLRQQSGEDVSSDLQIQLQTLRDLNLEYHELNTIGTQAEQTLSEKVRQTTKEINELNQSISQRNLWSRFEDRSLDRLKLNFEEKQAGKLFDDGKDGKEYARDKYQILQQRRVRLTNEYQIAQQDGEIQRDRLLTQLDDTQAKVVDLEFRLKNGEQVQAELQTQQRLLDELKARWEDLSLNGTDAERSIKTELQETNIELQETARELDPVGTKLTQTLGEGISNMFSGILLQGQSFKEAWTNLWSSIAQVALQQLIAMQLTKWGINSLFTRGGSVADAPVRGVSIGKTLAKGGFVGFANGGSVEEIDDLPTYATGGNIVNGGLIHGAGTSTSDSILTYLAHRQRFIRTSNGEYIIKQDSVQKLGVPFLDMLNQNPEAVASLKSYASGGFLGEEMIPEMSERGQNSYKSYMRTKSSTDNSGARQEKLLAEQNSLLSRYTQPVHETTNMNINAVDSKSFVQLLSRHSDVLIALLRKEQTRRNRY